MNSTIFMLLTLQFTLMVYEEYRAPKRREEAKPCISQDYFINVLLLPQPTKKFDSPELKKKYLPLPDSFSSSTFSFPLFIRLIIFSPVFVGIYNIWKGRTEMLAQVILDIFVTLYVGCDTFPILPSSLG